MSSKQKSTTTYSQLPVTQQQTQLASMVNQGSDPTIPYNYAKLKEQMENSYNNPLGAATSPAVRDAAARSQGQALGMEQANAVQTSNYNNNQAAFGRQATVAGMTAPVVTGGTQTSSPGIMGILGPIIGAGASVGAAALTGGGSLA